jgi:uncharacterized DUF497 family protein
MERTVKRQAELAPKNYESGGREFESLRARQSTSEHAAVTAGSHSHACGPRSLNRLEELDAQFVYDEERIQVIGMAQGDVLFVIVTFRGEDTCRIISARKATRHEQDRYYAGRRETW